MGVPEHVLDPEGIKVEQAVVQSSDVTAALLQLPDRSVLIVTYTSKGRMKRRSWKQSTS
jgi:hypothetical protein